MSYEMTKLCSSFLGDRLRGLHTLVPSVFVSFDQLSGFLVLTQPRPQGLLLDEFQMAARRGERPGDEVGC